MTKIEITHKLYGTQVKYGYIWWRAEKDNEFKKLFPKTKFIIEIDGRKIDNRKVDWNRRRLLVGKELKNNFKKDDMIILSKDIKNPKIIQIKRKKKR